MKTSVLVSMHNKRESVIQTIDKLFLPSLERNGSKDKEIIIIDDYSPLKKRTRNIIKKHMAALRSKFGKVIFLRNPHNLGFGGSYNRAISMATGKNLIITNDDVYLPRGSIDALVLTLAKNKKIGAVGPITGWNLVSTPQYCKQGPKIISYSKKDLQNIENFAGLIKRIMKNEPLVKNDILTGFCFATKKEILDKIGSYDEETFGFGYLEDTDLMRRIRQNYDIVIDSSIYIHHGGVEGASASFNQYKFEAIASYLTNCYKYAKKWHDFSGLLKLWATSIYNSRGYGTISDRVAQQMKSAK
jgi:GT2 family glycosyltransferase